MKRYTKTFIGSVITFLVGTSCCWLSTLTIWFGGVAFITVLVNWIESIQVLLIVLSVILCTFTLEGKARFLCIITVEEKSFS